MIRIALSSPIFMLRVVTCPSGGPRSIANILLTLGLVFWVHLKQCYKMLLDVTFFEFIIL